MYEVTTVAEHAKAGHDVIGFEQSPGLFLIVDRDDQNVMAWTPAREHAEAMARNLNR